jgi:hypothetical protein
LFKHLHIIACILAAGWVAAPAVGQEAVASGPRAVTLPGGHVMTSGLDGRPMLALEGGEALLEAGPGQMRADVAPGVLGQRVEGLATAALKQCDIADFDAKAAMRRAEAKGWPVFVNPRASHDYAPNRVFAEGLAQIRLSADARTHGEVGLLISDGEHHESFLTDRFLGCSVSFGPTDAAFAERAVRAVFGDRVTVATPLSSNPMGLRTRWILGPPKGQAAWTAGRSASVSLVVTPGGRATLSYGLSEARQP